MHFSQNTLMLSDSRGVPKIGILFLDSRTSLNTFFLQFSGSEFSFSEV